MSDHEVYSRQNNLPFPSLKTKLLSLFLGTGDLDIEETVAWVKHFRAKVDEKGKS
jgi:hypothetical protein